MIRAIIATSFLFVVLVGCVDMHSEKSQLVSVDPQIREWTIAVYMAADNDLESAAIQDLNEMEASIENGVTVVALLDRSDGYDGTNGNWDDSRLYQVEKDDSGLNGTIISRQLECPRLDLYLDRTTELNMADPWVLEGFLEYVMEIYPARHTVLVIWGHGTGWRSTESIINTTRAVAIDDTSGSYMRTSQLESAVAGKGLSAIIFDTCFGSTVETVYQLAPHAQLLAGPAGLTPAAGLDYQKVLETLTEGSDLTSLIQAVTADNSNRDQGAKMSVIDTAKVQMLRDSVEEFAKTLANTITCGSERDIVADILLKETRSYHHSNYPCDLFLDVADMAKKFTSHNETSVAEKAQELLEVVNNAVITPHADIGQVSIHLIPLAGKNTTATSHSQEYVKGNGVPEQGRFVTESWGWAPTDRGTGGSLLDKLFYTTY